MNSKRKRRVVEIDVTHYTDRSKPPPVLDDYAATMMSIAWVIGDLQRLHGKIALLREAAAKSTKSPRPRSRRAK